MQVLESVKPMKAIVVAPTGYGKALIVANIAKESKHPIILLHDSKELLKQNVEKYKSYGLTPSVYSASLNSRELGDVIFATIGSIKKEIAALREIGIRHIVLDECQNGSKRYGQLDKLLTALGITNLLGLTATPINLSSSINGSSLKIMSRDRNNLFTKIQHVVPIQEVVQQGYWTPIEYRIVDVDVKNLKLNTTGAEFTKESVKKSYTENKLDSKIYKEVDKLRVEGIKSIIVFAPSVEDTIRLKGSIKGSRCIYGDMKASERDKNLEDFKNGKFDVLINCQILQIGYDNPALGAIVMATPTNSVALYYQICGRLVRILEGKSKGIVVDLSGNVERFGRIEDFTFEDNSYTNGWAMFSKDKLLTNYPLGDFRHPTRASLMSAKKREEEEKLLPSTHKIHFGKYKGKTVDEIYKENKGYLVWLISNKDFNWVGLNNERLKVDIEKKLKLV
jgi:DNA repair protein RadD